MGRRLRVGILCGGKSAEHEVSLQSAKNIVEAMDQEKYEPVLMGIDKRGQWRRGNASDFLVHPDDPKRIGLNLSDEAVALLPGSVAEPLMSLSSSSTMGPIDVVFPVLHGPLGEDGTVQGLLKMLDLPFVGSGVLGSALSMDKDVTKRLLRYAGLPTPKHLAFDQSERARINFTAIARQLGLPVFVKPANLGSSVAITKARDRQDFEDAIDRALDYDRKVMVEEYIQGREIECSVLGNERPIASLPGEVIPRHDFYSYEAKYVDEQGARLEIPAQLDERTISRVQDLAIRTFQVSCCEGMARVDFFLRGEDEVIVNEINTIPGFTRISMYPKLWEASGITYPELIDRLIQLALERYEREKRLKTSYFE